MATRWTQRQKHHQSESSLRCEMLWRPPILLLLVVRWTHWRSDCTTSDMDGRDSGSDCNTTRKPMFRVIQSFRAKFVSGDPWPSALKLKEFITKGGSSLRISISSPEHSEQGHRRSGTVLSVDTGHAEQDLPELPRRRCHEAVERQNGPRTAPL